MGAKSGAPEHQDGIGLLSSSTAWSRRTFLAGVAASALTCPKLPAIGFSHRHSDAILHLADTSSDDCYVHSYRVAAAGCDLLGSTLIHSLAAFAAHPLLPMLYVARDCAQWENLPRGVVETYAVECSSRPLRLVAQTPMSLSATGPRSVAISSCGKSLLVSAASGGAWNAFALHDDGMPAHVAIACKETGIVADSCSTSLPAPHAVAFSPRSLIAVGTDPGTKRMSLLAPSADGIAVMARCHAPSKFVSTPAWTMDGKNIIAANPQTASLSLYSVRVSAESSASDMQLLSIFPTETPIHASLAHPEAPAIFTARSQQKGSRIELWKLRSDDLSVENSTWVPENVRLLVQHDGLLWMISEDRLIRMRTRDLRSVDTSKLQPCGNQAVITQIA